MLIDISLQDKKQLLVTIDPSHPKFPVVFIMVKSLLGAVEKEDNSWTVQYDDLKILRSQLDLAGLTEDREMSNEAGDWLDYLTSLEERNDAIKLGKYNDQMKELLEGKLKTVPYEDQYSAIAYLYYNKRCGLFDDLGSGKTLISLAAASVMPDVEKILVICPYTVLMGFTKEIKKHTYLRAAPIPQGRANALQYAKAAESSGEWDVMLVHPENLVQTKKDDPYSDLCKLLTDMTWDLILVDEGHLYKNLETKRTKCVMQIALSSRNRQGKYPRFVPITGTPVSESPLNAYVLLKMINYGKAPHISRFDNHFVVKEAVEHVVKGSYDPSTRKVKKATHLVVKGYRNLDELKHRLENVSIRRSKANMKGFPDRVFITREVTLEGPQLALYKTLLGEVVRELPYDSLINVQKFLETNEKAIRLRQCLNHPAIIGGTGDSAKYVELDNILEELMADPEKKVVVWTEYRKAVELLVERYKDLYGAVKLYGGVTNVELAKMAEAFEAPGWPRLIVSIPAKAGTGTDFLARARTAIYIERPASFVLYTQSLDRIHRRVESLNPTALDLIRSQPATIMYLDVLNSVDILNRDKLLGKKNVVDAVTTPDDELIEMGREDLLKYLQ